MYSVNKAKFDAHPDLAEELMGTYPCEIRGGPSTGWTYMVSMFRTFEFKCHVALHPAAR